MNSANRYYLNRFRDAYRQAVIGEHGRLSFESLFCIFDVRHTVLLAQLSASSAMYCISDPPRPHDGTSSNRRPVLHLQQREGA